MHKKYISILVILFILIGIIFSGCSKDELESFEESNNYKNIEVSQESETDLSEVSTSTEINSEKTYDSNINPSNTTPTIIDESFSESVENVDCSSDTNSNNSSLQNSGSNYNGDIEEIILPDDEWN